MLFRNKRGQVALEFLMTYGWAVLVVLIVISAIAFFLSANNPQDIIPESCAPFDGFVCDDFLISLANEGILVKLENNKGQPIFIKEVIGTSALGGVCKASPVIMGTTNPLIVGVGDLFTVNLSEDTNAANTPPDCTISNLIPGQKAKVSLEVKWYKIDPVFTHTSRGTLVANVES